jgi:phosphoglycolate phosphatase
MRAANIIGIGPQHIIWDWNGTLIDDVWLCVEILNMLLAERDLPATDQRQYQAAFDFPVKDYYVRLGFDFSRESFEQLADRYCRMYSARQPECGLQPGALGLIQAFAEAGISQSILSAYEQSLLTECVDHFDLGGFFDPIVGLDNFLADGKLENGRRLISQLGHGGPEVTLIGDTTHDFDVAQAIGVKCLLLASGHQSREKLENHGARVIDSLAEALALLG